MNNELWMFTHNITSNGVLKIKSIVFHFILIKYIQVQILKKTKTLISCSFLSLFIIT